MTNESDVSQRKDVARELISDGLLCVETRREKRLQKLVIHRLFSIWFLFLNLILIRLLYFRWVTTFQPKMRLRSAIWTFGDTATSPKTMPMNLVWVNVKFKLPHQFPDLIPHQTLSRGELIKAEWRVLEGLVTRSSYCHQLIHCSDLFRRCIYFSFFVVNGRSISNPWMVLTPPRHFV